MGGDRVDETVPRRGGGGLKGYQRRPSWSPHGDDYVPPQVPIITRTERCQECGSTSTPIVYGMPSSLLMIMAKFGLIRIGGCLMPQWPICRRCGNALPGNGLPGDASAWDLLPGEPAVSPRDCTSRAPDVLRFDGLQGAYLKNRLDRNEVLAAEALFRSIAGHVPEASDADIAGRAAA